MGKTLKCITLMLTMEYEFDELIGFSVNIKVCFVVIGEVGIKDEMYLYVLLMKQE